MAVASVTMFCACFSNGMSIMLPWKVNAPWKRENINLLRRPLEIVVGMCSTLKTHPFAKKHHLPQESWMSFRRQTNRDGANVFKEMWWVLSAPKSRQKEREKKRQNRERRSPACSLPVSASLAGKHRGPRAAEPRVPAGGAGGHRAGGAALLPTASITPQLQGWHETVCGRRAKPEGNSNRRLEGAEGSFPDLGVCWGCAAGPLHQVSAAKVGLGLCLEPAAGVKAGKNKWLAWLYCPNLL